MKRRTTRERRLDTAVARAFRKVYPNGVKPRMRAALRCGRLPPYIVAAILKFWDSGA